MDVPHRIRPVVPDRRNLRILRQSPGQLRLAAAVPHVARFLLGVFLVERVVHGLVVGMIVALPVLVRRVSEGEAGTKPLGGWTFPRGVLGAVAAGWDMK